MVVCGWSVVRRGASSLVSPRARNHLGATVSIPKNIKPLKLFGGGLIFSWMAGTIGSQVAVAKHTHRSRWLGHALLIVASASAAYSDLLKRTWATGFTKKWLPKFIQNLDPVFVPWDRLKISDPIFCIYLWIHVLGVWVRREVGGWRVFRPQGVGWISRALR